MRKNKLLVEGAATDLAIVFFISRKLVTPFNRWSAFELGIISDKGKILKKRLTTKEERNSFTLLDKFVLRLRTLIGDNLFVKIASVGLLLMHNENDSKIVIEEGSNNQKLFLKIQEQILELSSQVVVPLENRNEEIRIEYETNDIKNKFNFLLGVFLNDEMVTGLGGNFLPLNDVNGKFLIQLNAIINNLETGGNRTLILIDDENNEVNININYSSNEIKIQKVQDEVSLKSSVLADFYIIFSKERSKKDFVNGFNKINNKIKEK